jgi:GntR family transcriptional regulator
MGAQTAAEKIVAIRIDKTSPTPVYAQIAEALRALLASGAAPVGTPLPPERVLCEQFSVSRMTLRQAYDILERDGLLESHRGRGTFVAPIKMQKSSRRCGASRKRFAPVVGLRVLNCLPSVP